MSFGRSCQRANRTRASQSKLKLTLGAIVEAFLTTIARRKSLEEAALAAEVDVARRAGTVWNSSVAM